MTTEIRTDRLLLRPFQDDDAAAVAALAGNLDVARMTARIPHPFSEAQARQWIAGHPALRNSGDGYLFAIVLEGALVGTIGIERNPSGRYELGYWIGEPWWGMGIATEAARGTVRFAAETLRADVLEAGCLADNPASGRVLSKCGFVRKGEVMQWCEARRQAVKCHRLALAMDGGQADSGSRER
jgi:RimJ/RimL family protein N-acetyltransferase